MVKKLLAFFLLATSLALGQYTTTPNIGLELPANGSTSWNVPLNYNFALLDSLIGGTTQNPGVGLTLKPVFGNGAPAIACTSTNQGQQYFDTSTTPFTSYVCNNGAWGVNGSAGGGSFPTNAFVFGVTASTSRAATANDFSTLLSGLANCQQSNYSYAPANNSCVSGSQTYPAAGIPSSTGTGWSVSYTVTGTGQVIALQTSPTLIAPILGAATATSINGLKLGETLTQQNIYIGDNITIPGVGVTSDTVVGSGALKNDAGGQNSAFGAFSLANNSSGSGNSSFGNAALAGNTTGSYNAGFGVNSLGNNTTGNYNSAFGLYSLGGNTTGGSNSAFGEQALQNNSTGGSNSAFGLQAGYNSGTPLTSITNSEFFGANATSTTNGLTNMLVLGYQASGTASNQTTIGNSSTTSFIGWGVPFFPSLAGSGGCLGISTTGLGSVVSCGSGGGGNTTSTSLTSGSLTVANGANSIITSLFTDNGTTGGYSGTGGFNVYGTTPGGISWTAGSGNMNALPANSAGFQAPNSGGTPYLIQFPTTITAAGVAHLGTPGTVNNIRSSALSNSLIALADLGTTGTPSSSTFLRGDWSWATATGGGGTPIYTHTLSGATPTLAVNSNTTPAIDKNYLPMSANVTSITLPASSAVSDGEIIDLVIAQPASGGPYTLPTGTASSPLTPGSGTGLVTTASQGCPTIGTTVSSSSPSELFMEVQYKASLTQYAIIECKTATPVRLAVNEATLSSGSNQSGTYSVGIVLATTVPLNPGRIVNLTANYTQGGGGGCTTAPFFNVFDGTTNVGTAMQGPIMASSPFYQVKGTSTTQSENLSFNAGDQIGIYISTAGATCQGIYVVSAQYVEP